MKLNPPKLTNLFCLGKPIIAAGMAGANAVVESVNSSVISNCLVLVLVLYLVIVGRGEKAKLLSADGKHRERWVERKLVEITVYHSNSFP